MALAFVTGGSGFLGQHLITALCERGETVRALARSPRAAAVVASLGAEPVAGDLADLSDAGRRAALVEKMRGARVVYHSAAYVADWGPPQVFRQVNVEGTRGVLQAARMAGVSRFVHVSTDAVLAGDEPTVNADESMPRAAKPIGIYSVTKAMAEEVVMGDHSAMTKVIVRPRLIWGAGDTTLLPQFVAVVEQGQYYWIGRGEYLTSTCHVRNACEGLLLAADKGRDRNIYFLTDGGPIVFRSFITQLLETQGVDPGSRNMHPALAQVGGWVAEHLWRYLPLPGRPPLTRGAVRSIGQEVTVSDAKARRELGYRARCSFEEGLEEMRRARQTTPTTPGPEWS